MKKKPKILIICSEYNGTSKLLKSAKIGLLKKGIKFECIKVYGAFEIPVSISRNIKKYDGFVALGIIIKGQTANFNLISQAITNALMELSILHKKPIGNGVLTCLNNNQAKKRFHKGEEAVNAVLTVLANG